METTWKTLCISLVSMIVLLSILSSVHAEFNYSESILEQEMSVNILNNIESSASRVIVNLSIVPINDERQTSIINAYPPGNLFTAETKDVIFKFNEKGTLLFGLDSNVKTRLLIKPLKFISLDNMNALTDTQELIKYKKPSNYADSENSIVRSKAEQLTQNTNNSVEALFILADYIKNSMNYNLGHQDLQKASQILQEKQGVCAHYTILFIAMTRALGFPSRYISGVAYSNKVGDFEEHAWAEIYIPEQGWVPFDVTFGQYGWLDTSHVALKESMDAGESSVRYDYINGHIQTNQIEIKTKVLSYNNNNFSSNISFSLEPYQDKVSQESYLPLKVRIENKNDYFISLPLRVSIAPEVYGKSEKTLLLEPNSIQETYFLVYFPYKVKCSQGCKTYVEVMDAFGDFEQHEVIFSNFNEKITLQDALDIINEPKPQDIDFYCRFSNLTEQESISKTITCFVKTKEQEKLKLCYQQQCVEQVFEKDKLTSVPIIIQTNQTKACIKLEDTNITLDSCAIQEDQKKGSWLSRFFEWINFELDGFFLFLRTL